jgi:hypothetical protein
MPLPSHNRDPAEGKSFDPADAKKPGKRPSKAPEIEDDPDDEGLLGPEGDPAEGSRDIRTP